MISLTFFGTSAAAVSVARGFTCIGIRDESDLLVLDCGDGSIKNLMRYGADVREISNILVTHCHSDHISGLTQIVETMSMSKKQTELNVFGPAGLVEYFSTVQRITNVAFHRQFQINLKELTPNQHIKAGRKNILTFEMDHTLPCLGYRVELEGRVVSFTGDTQPCASLNDLGKDSNVFIHEATFLQKDLDKARQSRHSTPLNAAIAALSAKTSKLILTHVNDESEKPEEMIAEAGEKFDKVTVAYDGLTIDL
ncbi:MAG: ribonuclease Z [Nitrososphaerota archaeon]|nr:ribonuclease Z [Nitrososphaerota archaeon]